MDERNVGCSLAIALLILGFVFSINLMPAPHTVALTPTFPIYSPYEILSTGTPHFDLPDLNGTYFVVQDNQVTYAYTETINCQYVFAGYIILLDSNSYVPDSVVIHLLAVSNGESSIIYPYPSVEDTNLLSWNVLLPHVARAYNIWIEDSVDGRILSPRVRFETEDCINTLFVVNFEQVTELP